MELRKEKTILNLMKKIFKTIVIFILLIALIIQSTSCMCIPAVLAGLAGTVAVKEAEEAEKQNSLAASYDRKDDDEPIVDVLSNSTDDSAREIRHSEIPFSKIRYSRPDTQELKDSIAILTKEIQSGSFDEKKVMEDYRKLLSMYDEIDTQSAIAYVLYAENVNEPYYDEEYEFLMSELDEADILLTDLSILMYETEEIGEALREEYGNDYETNVYQGKTRKSKDIQEYLNRDRALSSEYDSLSTSFVMKDGDREYSIDDILVSEDNGYEEYMRLVNMYYEQFNRAAADIFLEMVQLRTKLAKALGFRSYSEYAYEDYGRDYSTEEVRKIHQAVKDYIVPIYRRITFSAAILSLFSDEETTPEYSEKGFIKQFRESLARLSPKMTEALDYMLRNEMISSAPSKDKMETNFTTFFADYNTPFIFTQWESDSSSVSTMIHEFGHSANYYINPVYGWNILDPLDLAEVDSQGLEMLMMKDYETFFGEKNADAMRLEKLSDAMYSLISGCMEDEFQQKVYENPDMTLEELNTLYASLADEYGFADLFGYAGVEWAAVPHTFQSPMYYISYATSQIVALEIWEKARTDEKNGEEIYLKILNRPAFSKFRSFVQSCGLSDPLDPDTIIRLSETINSAVKDLL